MLAHNFIKKKKQKKKTMKYARPCPKPFTSYLVNDMPRGMSVVKMIKKKNFNWSFIFPKVVNGLGKYPFFFLENWREYKLGFKYNMNMWTKLVNRRDIL